MKDSNNEESKDSNFTLELQREGNKVKNSISPTTHPDSTLGKNPLQFALAHTNVSGRHYLRNAKELVGEKGENIKTTNTHVQKDGLRVIKMKMNKGFSCNHF